MCVFRGLKLLAFRANNSGALRRTADEDLVSPDLLRLRSEHRVESTRVSLSLFLPLSLSLSVSLPRSPYFSGAPLFFFFFLPHCSVGPACSLPWPHVDCISMCQKRRLIARGIMGYPSESKLFSSLEVVCISGKLLSCARAFLAVWQNTWSSGPPSSVVAFFLPVKSIFCQSSRTPRDTCMHVS